MKSFNVIAKVNLSKSFYVENKTEEEAKMIVKLYYQKNNQIERIMEKIEINIEEIKTLEEFFI
jgi:predicted transcriptional regulator